MGCNIVMPDEVCWRFGMNLEPPYSGVKR
jgi:hypothetical protein